MSGQIAERIQKKLPVGVKLPATFQRLVDAGLPVEVKWTNLSSHELKPAVKREAVPFLALGDGGVICFWFHGATVAIIHIGTHGDSSVIAASFNQFLGAINARQTGVPELDEPDEPIYIPGIRKTSVPKNLARLQTKFERWMQFHSALQKPLETATTEKLRIQIVRLAKAMVKNGVSKVYSVRDPDWSMTFRAHRTATGMELTYLDYGEWYPVPANAGFEAPIKELLALVKNPERKQFEISTQFGIVSVDRDQQLVLVPTDSQF